MYTQLLRGATIYIHTGDRTSYRLRTRLDREAAKGEDVAPHEVMTLTDTVFH